MSSELGKKKRDARNEQLKKAENADKSLADFLEACERMLNALEKFEASGSPLFKQQFKHATISYRKKVFNELNKTYDFMGSYGAGDFFMSNIKANSMLHGLIGTMDAEQRNELIIVAQDILTREDMPEVEAAPHVEAKLEPVEDTVEVPVTDLSEEDEQSLIDAYIDALPSDEDGDKPFINPMDKVFEEGSIKEVEIEEKDSFEITVSAEDAGKVQDAYLAIPEEDRISFNDFFIGKALEKANKDEIDWALDSVNPTDDNGYKFTFNRRS